MKPEELRIGNLISYNNNSFKVFDIAWLDDLDADKSGYLVNGIWLEECRPITLTEYWLVRFAKPESKLNLSFMLGDFKLWVDKTKNESYFVWRKQHIKIKYVHQLQNLYYSLAGKELELQPTKTLKELEKKFKI